MLLDPYRRTLVIGDVHGHYDRLLDLLQTAGILDEHGQRIDHQSQTLQVGDLGHFGDNLTGSWLGDQRCWELAWEALDGVLWGNHDWALRDPKRAFHGYVRPRGETVQALQRMQAAGRLGIAVGLHGYLITHAGLHAAMNALVQEHQGDPVAIAAALEEDVERSAQGEHVPVIDNVSHHRFGGDRWGGVLWCDWNEKRARGLRQIVGHSVSHRTGTVRRDNQGSVGLDVGTINNGKLSAIWLPDGEIVSIDRPDWGDTKITYSPR
jgi:hypothetical protein